MSLKYEPASEPLHIFYEAVRDPEIRGQRNQIYIRKGIQVNFLWAG